MHYRAIPRRFRRATLLLVGCGDVGLRIGAQSIARHPSDRLRVVGTVRDAARAELLRRSGIVPLRADLDDRRSLTRIAPLARWMVDLAPPPSAGDGDPRSTRLIASVSASSRKGDRPTRRWVYVSTTGVYGNAGGAFFDESRPVAPTTARAIRRVDAERRFRAAAARGVARVSTLRAPGIHDSLARLPLDRLRKGLPALLPGQDVYTNHIHAEDLAALCRLALFRGAACRVYHAVDDTDLKMGEYLDRVADASGLPRPRRLDRDRLASEVSPMMLTFMSESRRLANHRIRRELRARLSFPTVDVVLAGLRDRML